MKIIKYPNFKHIRTCNNCGCVFELEQDDTIDCTIYQSGYTGNNFKHFFVRCPLCNAEHEIKFENMEDK